MGTNGFQGQIAALVYDGKKFPKERKLIFNINLTLFEKLLKIAKISVSISSSAECCLEHDF